MTIITIAQHKGGVGKSTLAWALSSRLAKDHEVLAVDLDPQGTLSGALSEGPRKMTVANVLGARARTIDSHRATQQFGRRLRILGSSPALAGLDAETAGRIDRQYIIADMLADASGLVVIDTPASQGILTTAALAAADFCLTPCSTDDAAFLQLPAFAATIDVIKRRINPRLVWLPLVATMFDQRQVIDRSVLAAMHEQYDIFNQSAPRRVAIREQMAAGQPCTVPEFESLTIQVIKEIRRHEEEVRGPPPRKR